MMHQGQTTSETMSMRIFLIGAVMTDLFWFPRARSQEPETISFIWTAVYG